MLATRPKAMDHLPPANVGAIFDRPRSSGLLLRRRLMQKGRLCRRTINNRPYKFYCQICKFCNARFSEY